jgi:hypothetical protein
LLGADISKIKARPGDKVEITWYFESLKSVTGGWKMFVHFDGPGQRFIADHVPVEGALPFSDFKPGQFIADRQTVVVPASAPAGEYGIWVGLFSGRKRAPVNSAGEGEVENDRLRIGALDITR